MCPPEHSDGDGDAQLGWSDKFAPDQLLAAIDHGHERNDGCLGLQPVERLAEACLESSVPMPDGKQMVCDQPSAGHQHEAASDPEGMAHAPENLPDSLRVSADPDDAGGVEPHLRLQHRRDLEQVVGGWVQEQETDGCHDPDGGHHPRHPLDIPDPDSVIAVSQEVADHHHG